MRSLLVCSILSLGLGWAQHSIAAPSPETRCEPIAKIKADVKGAKVTQLNIGQYHVMMGVYLGSALTPEGLPPGDGAMLVQGKKAAILFWTKGDKDACIVQLKMQGPDGHPHAGFSPLIMPPEMVAILKGISGGKDEIAAPAEDDSKDLHL